MTGLHQSEARHGGIRRVSPGHAGSVPVILAATVTRATPATGQPRHP